MKKFLIIGGSSGIGKAVANLLLEKGHQVFATYHTKTPSIQDSEINYFKFNILEEKFSFEHLPEKIDGLVYCPGAINLKPFHRIPPEAFSTDYQLQVVGAVKVIQEVLPRLKASETASIVLFSTVAVQTGFNFHSLVSASKGAIEGLTRALAAEFAPKIRVNCVAPSLTDTPLASRLLNTPEKITANAERHPLKRIGNASDIANAVNFLLSEDSGWITGQVLKTDGGISTINI